MRILLPFLLAAPLLAQETPGESAAVYNALNTEYNAATRKFSADYREARKKDPKARYDASKHPNIAFAARFDEFARKYAGTPSAVKALSSLLRMAPTEKGKQAALDSLLSDEHIVLKEIHGALFNIRYAYWADRPTALRAIADKTPHHAVKGKALLQLGWVLKHAEPKQALEVLQQVQKKYADVPYSGKRTVADQAGNEIYEITHLSVGKPVPDIVGEDLDGKPMKLSDFYGKVVFLDFWGDW